MPILAGLKNVIKRDRTQDNAAWERASHLSVPDKFESGSSATIQPEGCSKSIAMNRNVLASIVVPTYDRPAAMRDFVLQIQAQTHERFRLIVVDHGTEPVDLAACDDERICVLRESSELWWTGAINRGIEYALGQEPESDFILVINDDTRFDATYLQSLVELGTGHPHSIIGSISVDGSTGEILSGSFSLNKLKARFVPHYYKCTIDAMPDTCLPTDILPGRGMLVPCGVFERIGLFLETALPHYGADNEFSYRAKKAGYDLLVSKACLVRTGGKVPLSAAKGRWDLAGQHLFGPRSKGNLPMLFNLSRHYFRSPYSLYFFMVNCILKVLSTVKHCCR